MSNIDPDTYAVCDKFMEHVELHRNQKAKISQLISENTALLNEALGYREELKRLTVLLSDISPKTVEAIWLCKRALGDA